MYVRAKAFKKDEAGGGTSDKNSQDAMSLEFYQFYEFISNDIAKSLYHSDNEFIELENYVLNKQAKFRRAMSEYDIHGRSSPSAKKRGKGKAKAASIERS